MQLLHILSGLEDALLTLERYRRDHPNEDIDGMCEAYGIGERVRAVNL